MAGQATVFHWAIAVRPDETERRINGQHSSTSLATLDMSGAYAERLDGQS